MRYATIVVLCGLAVGVSTALPSGERPKASPLDELPGRSVRVAAICSG